LFKPFIILKTLNRNNNTKHKWKTELKNRNKG
jgi:hypothetical protein